MKIIKYSGRILSVIIFLFFTMFILEGFSPGFSWRDGLMHGLLALGILGVTIICWKWPKIGGWFFAILGIACLFMIFRQHWWGGVIIGGVPLLAGTLFLIDGFKKKN